jgi:hypothetical protein
LNPTYSAGRKLLALDAGSIALTNDLGEFRIFGLAPGSFYVATLTPVQMPAENSTTSFAPAYYPGTTNFAEAQRVVVKLGGTASNIDLRTVPTRMATVSGVAVDDGDRPMATPMLGVRQLDAGVLLTFSIERVGTDGSFRLQNLAPGEYEVRVTGTSAPPERTPLTATTRVSVNGADISGLHLVAAAAGAFAVGATRVEIVDAAESVPYQPRAVGLTPVFPVRPDLTFSATTPFTRAIAQLASLPRGWYLKAVRLDGVDVSDGIDFRPGNAVTGLQIEVTDHPSEISGSVRSTTGDAIDDYTVVVFARDPARRKGVTRRFATARPDVSGKFAIYALPPGDYYAIALEYADAEASADPDFLEPLEARATAFTLGDGQQTTLDLKLVH